MKVIAKKTSSRVLKDNEYEVLSIWNDGTEKWRDGSLKLVNVSGYLKTTNFTTLSGEELPKIKFDNDVYKYTSYDELSVNDILICITDRYKSMVKGGYYKIEKLLQVKGKYNIINYVKLEGVSRKILFDSYCLEKLPTHIAREMSLNQVLYDEDDKVIRTDFKKQRKLDFVVNKELFFMELLSKSILDKNRHDIDIIDWACVQSKKKIDLTREDFDDVLNMSLGDILKLIDK